MRSKIFFLLAVILFSFSAYGQESCGFDDADKYLQNTDPLYKAHVEKAKKNWAKFAASSSAQRLLINGNDTVYEIPVVIHVIHTGGAIGTPFNPSDQQLIDRIDYTNKCYEATWAGNPPPGSGGVRVPFRFVLAKRDPACDSSTGIVRVDGSSVPDYVANGIELSGGIGASETAVKSLSVWPNDKFYNIWVVNYIGGPGGGTAGYAYYPGAGPAVDGTVVLAAYSAAGSSTLVHEIGHGMGLPHTFEGDNGGASCPVNNDCNIDGDGICDTEPHKRSATCTDVINPCTNQPYGFTRNSFMSYTHGCRDRFSAGQKAKMLFNLKNNRTSLMRSNGALPPTPQASPALCLPISSNPSGNANVGPQIFTFVSIHDTSGGANTEGTYIDKFCDNFAQVHLGESYPILIKTGPQVENVRLFIDYNNDGVFQLPQEEAYGHNGTASAQYHVGLVNIPDSNVVICQPLRMRLVSDVASAGVPSPCGPYAYGQAEDYVVIVKPSTGAALTTVPMAPYPFCEDSLVTFRADTTKIPSSATITWLINGVPVATGYTFTTSVLKPGDKVSSTTSVLNNVCNTPDTVVSSELSFTTLPGSAPPLISFINGDLYSNLAPVQWYGPNGIINGATSQIYHPLMPGNYYARVLSLPCPSAKSNILNVSQLNIESVDNLVMKVFPNPASDLLTIEVPEGYAHVYFTLFNLVGQEVARQTSSNTSSTSMSVSHLPAGMYILSIRDEKGRSGRVKVQIMR